MRDQPLTAEQAARWLDCSAEEVRSFVEAGKLRPYGGAAEGEIELLSLNSVVVLAESLPPDRGIFRVRDMPGGDHGGGGGYAPRPQGGRGQGERPGFVVERRTPGRRI